MARKPAPRLEQPDGLDEKIMASDADRIARDAEQTIAEADGVRIATEKYNEGRDIANRLIGQFKMARSVEHFSRLSAVLSLREVKENKLYRHCKTPDGRQFTWAMYCEEAGTSSSTADELITNLNVFGEDFFSSLQNLGMGIRELRKLRALPDEDRQLVINNEAIDAGDKEAIRDLIEDIIQKKDAERSAAEERAKKAEEENTIKDSLLADKNRRIDELAAENELRSGNLDPEAPSALAMQAKASAEGCVAHLATLMAIINQTDDGDQATVAALHAGIEEARAMFAAVREEHLVRFQSFHMAIDDASTPAYQAPQH